MCLYAQKTEEQKACLPFCPPSSSPLVKTLACDTGTCGLQATLPEAENSNICTADSNSRQLSLASKACKHDLPNIVMACIAVKTAWPCTFARTLSLLSSHLSSLWFFPPLHAMGHSISVLCSTFSAQDRDRSTHTHTPHTRLWHLSLSLSHSPKKKLCMEEEEEDGGKEGRKAEKT